MFPLLHIITSVITSLLVVITYYYQVIITYYYGNDGIITRFIIGNKGSIITYYWHGQLKDVA